MDTKLKNRMTGIAWLFLFSFGASGALTLLSFGSGYPDERYLIYALCGVAALVASFWILKKTSFAGFLPIEKWQFYYNKIPLDVALVLIIIFGSYALSGLSSLDSDYLILSALDFVKNLLVCSITVALTIIQGQLIWKRLIDEETLITEWKKSLLNKIFTGIRDAFLNRSTGVQTLLILGIMAASGFGIPVVFIQPAALLLYFPLFLIVTVPALVVIFGRVGYFNRILENTSQLVRGHFVSDLPVKGRSHLATLAENVNTLRQGVETSQAEQAKSERFKTELITNVSHDLRTPLTSIITYSELLKTPELSDDERDAYIEIIDRKSKRLKVLIEDLFEASKMASGSIELVKEKVDMNQLLQQALAENDERIGESTLQFRVTKPDTPVYCIVDGQKLWRVFDNLIGNILKYSLEHTRVYISVKTIQEQVVMTFKNITKYELSENIDELFERFKRGDESRHTDGSGLGLAIAKSIVDLHGGSLDIEVDGDLFKVTVSLQSFAD